MQLESTRRQNSHLFNTLLAIQAIRHSQLLFEPQLRQLLLAVGNLTAPAEYVARRVADPVRSAVLSSGRCIDKDTDVPVPHTLASYLVGPNVQIVSLQINVEQVFANNVADVFKTHRFTREHASQHALNATVERCQR